MNDQTDPYYLSQREVVTGISTLRSQLQNRDDILTDSRGGNHEVFKSLAAQMRDGIRTVRNILEDLSGAISQVQSNRAYFKISDAELCNRERFLADSREQVDDIEKRMADQTASQKLQFSVSAFQPVSPVGIPSRELGPGQMQLQLYQEEQIEKIADTVRVQKQLGREIGHAIDEQRDMIVAIDAGINTADAAMKQVTQRITQLIENEGKVPTYLVAVLSVILILMLWWVA